MGNKIKLIGPERYELSFNPQTFVVACVRGTAKFSPMACSKVPKLYVVSVDDKPVYVGITKRPMRARLRFGFTAAGKGGYYGYAWRKHYRKATLNIWAHVNSTNKVMLDLETVEAEVVFLARCSGQWPECQTEIHFHASRSEHRELADSIWKAVTNWGRSSPTCT
jgi:hypothetical protein